MQPQPSRARSSPVLISLLLAVVIVVIGRFSSVLKGGGLSLGTADILGIVIAIALLWLVLWLVFRFVVKF
jgi:hypothetical protein